MMSVLPWCLSLSDRSNVVNSTIEVPAGFTLNEDKFMCTRPKFLECQVTGLQVCETTPFMTLYRVYI